MPKGVYVRRDLAAHCVNCGRGLPAPSATRDRRGSRRRYCPPCLKRRQHGQKAASRRKQQIARTGPEGTWGEPQQLVVSDAFRRQQADAALDKSPHKRHCSCGQWYLMTSFTTPCPYCSDALDPNPGG